MGKNIDAIKILIVLNLLFFAGTYFLGFRDEMFQLFALYFPQNQNFNYWQYVSNMFMHGGYAHIFMNMYGLWAFGSPLEQMWGKKRFLFFYFMAGIGASLIYTLVNYIQFQEIFNDLIQLGLTSPEIQKILESGEYNSQLNQEYSEEKLEYFYRLFHTPAVGASGAVYGILVAFGCSFPNAKLALIFFPVPIAAKYFIPLLIAIDLFSGVTGFSLFGGGIAHFAHVGGALIGFLLMLYWRRKYKNSAPYDPDSSGPMI